MTPDYERMMPRRTKPIPEINSTQAYCDIQRRRHEESAARQMSEFRQNEKLAQNIIENLPAGLAFPVVILKQERAKNGSFLKTDPVSEEIKTNVYIVDQNGKKISYRFQSDSKQKETTYSGFCLLTKLLIREENGLLTPNLDYIQSLQNQYIPDQIQVRSAA